MRTRLAVAILLLPATTAFAQQPPAIGYMHPAGAAAGTTVEVTLGGYDWTPDMQIVVHDPRIEIDLLTPPGPPLVPEPPYWFGKKARRPPFLLPRETRAKLTIPADVPPGLVKWQVANANGASPVSHFVVAPKGSTEIVEAEGQTASRELPALPVSVSGCIRGIEEVDRYRFTAQKTGLVTARLVAPSIGSDLNAVIEIRDDTGRLVANVADTAGDDLAFVVPVEAKRTYEVTLYDLDFRGNRAFVYRLSLRPGPLVVATIPATAPAGAKRDVEFVGYGIATGKPVLESVTRPMQFPKDAAAIDHTLQTPHGDADPFRLFTTEHPCLIAPTGSATKLVAPVVVSDVLTERYSEKRYTFDSQKGDRRTIRGVSRDIGGQLDVTLAVLDATGTEVARSDDGTDSTDATLAFVARADGEHTLVVTDFSGRSGNRAAVVQVEFTEEQPGFAFDAPELLAIPIGGTGKLTVRVTRTGGFLDAIPLSFDGLPPGITLPEPFEIPAKKNVLTTTLATDAKGATAASLVTLVGEVTVEGRPLRHEAGPTLVVTTIPPPFGIDAEGQDDVTKWPRGTTFPAPVLIERDAGFTGEITLEMAAKQGRHRQGIRGPELVVAPGVERILYPVMLPEWLETTRTSRMTVNGRAKVTDPAGNVRYSLVRQKTRMGFLPTGALLKLAATPSEIVVRPGESFVVPLDIARSDKLTESLHVELATTQPESAAFTTEPLDLPADATSTEVGIQVAKQAEPGDHRLTLRATALQDGKYPVVSEATFDVRIEP